MVDFLTNHGFFLNIDLRITGNTCGEVGRQCDSLIESIRVQRLCVSESSGHSFDTGTADVVERVLLSQ